MNASSCRWLVAMVLLVCSAAAAAEKVVARVKVHNPLPHERTDVIVRGCLPLPADYGKPVAALALRDGEHILPTQVSVFATYPDADEKHPVGRPEVVQLAARVAKLPANDFKELDVVELDAPPAGAKVMEIPAPLAAWLEGKTAPLVVEAADVFGNRYRAEPLAKGALIETRQTGPVLIERVYQTILTPVAPGNPDKPALKRFLRVRAYLTLHAKDNVASLALMIHNGSSDHPNGTVYYRDIRVGVAKGMEAALWHKDFSPAADGTIAADKDRTWIPCPPPLADGKVFVLPQGGAAVLRMALHAADEKDRARDFTAAPPIFVPVPSLEQFSWSNPATARYDAPKWPMPLRLEPDALQRAQRETDSAFGSPTLGWNLTYLREKDRPARRALGHALPAGVAYGGMTGGGGILYVFGVRAAITGHNGLIGLHVMLADRNFDRQHMQYFYDDGRPFTYGKHVVELDGQKVLDWPYDNRGSPQWPADDPACKAHADHVAAKDLLSAEATWLLRYMNHDDQHLARVFDAVPAAYLACDALNRDRLVVMGARACWTRGIYPLRGRKDFGGWGSLVNIRKHVDAHPHAGAGMGRSDGWVTHSLGWGMCLSQDKQIRADCLAVAAEDAEVRAKAQMPGGNVTLRAPFSKAFEGGYFFVTPWEEGAILADGARSVLNILDAAHAAQAETLRKTYAGVGRWMAATGWNEKANAPAFQTGLRKKDQSEWLKEPVHEGGSAFYMGTPFAWYYELTGEKRFVERLNEMAGDGGLERTALKDIGNWSYPLHLLQAGKLAAADK